MGNYDLICHSFTESFIWKVSEFTNLISPNTIFRRDYGVVLNYDPPINVSGSDHRVIEFFQKVMNEDEKAFFETDFDFKRSHVVLYDQVHDQYSYFDNVHVHIKYFDMPMPPTFWDHCSRERGVHCSLFCLSGSCVSHQCICPNDACAFEGGRGYCKGQNDAPDILASDATWRTNTTSFLPPHAKGPVRIAAVAAFGGVAGLILAARWTLLSGSRIRMNQPELLG